MLLKNEFLNKWAEVSGFNFRKLLEDNQRISMPMLTLVDKTPVIFAFVYSALPDGRLVVSQRHIWSADERRMMLCKTFYEASLADILTDETDYIDALSDAAALLFKAELSSEERAICERYFACFNNEALRRLYFSENKPLAKWAQKQSFLQNI